MCIRDSTYIENFPEFSLIIRAASSGEEDTMTLCLLARHPTHKVRSLEDAVPDVGKLVPAPVSVQIRFAATTTKKDNTSKCQVGLPYVRGLSEQLRKVFRRRNCGVYFKPQNTLRRLLCAPKDPAKKEEASGVVYRVNCGHLGYGIWPSL